MHFSVEKTYYGLSYAKKRKYDLLSTIYVYYGPNHLLSLSIYKNNVIEKFK